MFMQKVAIFIMCIWIFKLHSMSISIHDDLVYQFDEQHIVDVRIDIDDDNSTTIPVISYPSSKALRKGSIVIVSDVDSFGLKNSTLLNLASELPHWGWDVFLVYADSLLLNQFNQADDISDSNDEVKENSIEIKANSFQGPELAYDLNASESFLQTLYESLHAYLLPKTGYKLMLAQGKMAAAKLVWLSSLSQEQQSKWLDAVILSNAHWPLRELNRNIPAQLAAVSIPVLDIHSESDNKWAQNIKNDKKIRTEVDLKTFYRQVSSPYSWSPSSSAKDQARHVVAYTRYLGW